MVSIKKPPLKQPSVESGLKHSVAGEVEENEKLKSKIKLASIKNPGLKQTSIE